MSKSVRWQIPFASNITLTKYRIDIYDNGTYSTPIILTAGDHPLNTEEDSNDDFFIPLRKQTGKIRICTKIEPQTALPSGGMLDIADLLPATNVDRPVRVVRINDSTTPATETIEWQGFVSCEVFSQNYTGIPDNVDINIISVLEAMDSVEVELRSDMAFRRVIAHIAYAMQSIATKSDMSDLWGNVYIADYCFDAVIDKSFYSNVYFSTEEIISGDNVTVETHSISCKKILERIAQFFGCCWREAGRDIFMEYAGNLIAYNYLDYYTIVTKYLESTTGALWNHVTQWTVPLSGLTWRGSQHKRNISQGRRRIKVEANLKDFEMDMELRETPKTNLVENLEQRQSTWGEVFCHYYETYYNLAEHKHFRVIQNTFYNPYQGNQYEANVRLPEGENPFLPQINYDKTLFYDNIAWLQKYQSMIFDETADSVEVVMTSFMGWLKDTNNKLVSGLFVCGLPRAYRQSDASTLWNDWFLYTQSSADLPYHVFHQQSGLMMAANDGKIRLELEIMAVATNRELIYNNQFNTFSEYPSVMIGIRIGEKWAKWNDNTSSLEFVDYFQTIQSRVTSSGLSVMEGTITSSVQGIAHIYIFPVTGGHTGTFTQTVKDVFISKLNLSYRKPERDIVNDRDKNVYLYDTKQKYKDDMTVSLDLATNVNNDRKATLLWTNSTTPVTLLSLGGSQVRPEEELSARIAAQYYTSRQKLELEAAPITIVPLSRIKMTGIGPDTRIYLPIAESRDWMEETSKITCMEMPN